MRGYLRHENSTVRRAARTDDNHQQIVKELRCLGYSCHSTAAVGDGFPDICVGANRMVFLFEIKDPAKPPSARKLTYAEERFHKQWKGQVDIIHSTEDALRIIKNALAS